MCISHICDNCPLRVKVLGWHKYLLLIALDINLNIADTPGLIPKAVGETAWQLP